MRWLRFRAKRPFALGPVRVKEGEVVRFDGHYIAVEGRAGGCHGCPEFAVLIQKYDWVEAVPVERAPEVEPPSRFERGDVV